MYVWRRRSICFGRHITEFPHFVGHDIFRFDPWSFVASAFCGFTVSVIPRPTRLGDLHPRFRSQFGERGWADYGGGDTRTCRLLAECAVHLRCSRCHDGRVRVVVSSRHRKGWRRPADGVKRAPQRHFWNHEKPGGPAASGCRDIARYRPGRGVRVVAILPGRNTGQGTLKCRHPLLTVDRNGHNIGSSDGHDF